MGKAKRSRNRRPDAEYVDHLDVSWVQPSVAALYPNVRDAFLGQPEEQLLDAFPPGALLAARLHLRRDDDDVPQSKRGDSSNEPRLPLHLAAWRPRTVTRRTRAVEERGVAITLPRPSQAHYSCLAASQWHRRRPDGVVLCALQLVADEVDVEPSEHGDLLPEVLGVSWVLVTRDVRDEIDVAHGCVRLPRR